VADAKQALLDALYRVRVSEHWLSGCATCSSGTTSLVCSVLACSTIAFSTNSLWLLSLIVRVVGSREALPDIATPLCGCPDKSFSVYSVGCCADFWVACCCGCCKCCNKDWIDGTRCWGCCVCCLDWNKGLIGHVAVDVAYIALAARKIGLMEPVAVNVGMADLTRSIATHRHPLDCLL